MSTLEGRKNHLTLLHAAERLWSEGVDFKLELIGVLNKETGSEAARLVYELQDKGRAVTWRSGLSSHELHEAYLKSTFTVYPSLAEGFGLPVIESLKHGRACIVGKGGSLEELGQDGGCYIVDTHSEMHLAGAIKHLLSDDSFLFQLEQEAANRSFRTWSDYADGLMNQVLGRRVSGALSF